MPVRIGSTRQPDAFRLGDAVVDKLYLGANEIWTAAVAPAFADPTGDAIRWTRGARITPIIVPEATGKPTPTYAAVGRLPAGLIFQADARAIIGTPTTSGSGTITIRATNSAGSADWTMAYGVTNRVTVALGLAFINRSSTQWVFSRNSYLSLGSNISASGREIFLATLILPRLSSTVHINLTSSQTSNVSGADFSTQMEASGTIMFTASNGDTVTITGISDATEPYSWTPTNASAVRTFANTVAGLADKSVTVTFDDNSD